MAENVCIGIDFKYDGFMIKYLFNSYSLKNTDDKN